MEHQRGILLDNRADVESEQGKMIRSIQIQGYRGFTAFEMSGLKRVTLLVGTNNSGKTSALEALYLLASQGDPYSLWRVLWRRSEKISERSNANYPEIDVSHLFTGHEMHLGSKFAMHAENQTPGRNVSFTVIENADEARAKTVRQGVSVPSRLGLQIKGTPGPNSTVLPLSRSGGISSEALDVPRRLRKKSEDEEIPSQFITAESFSASELLAVWDTIALTANESRVLEALRLLEPMIERIAATAAVSPHYYDGSGNQRGGFRVKFSDMERPVPIGSMGDGIWRLLVIAIAIAQCKDGVLLIDEIDTGLHYSVMTKMWKLIFGAAKELNVQVFATTHSYDCVKSLAELCYSEAGAESDVTLQRIEKGKKKAIPYSAAEIETAAMHHIEVR